jgi:tyrosinase
MKAFGHLTRRDLIAGAAALGLASAFGPSLHAQQHLRRSVSGPESDPAMLDAYKSAIQAMLRLPPSDPHNWYRQALIHLLDCPHGNWWFLPWHRGYIYNFEQICRKRSGVDTFALPFWDWTAQPRVPDVLFDDVLDPAHGEYEASFETFQTKFKEAIPDYWARLTDRQKDDLKRRSCGSLTSADAIMQCIETNWRPTVRQPTRQQPSFNARTALAVSITSITDALVPTVFEDFGSGQAERHLDKSNDSAPLEGGPHNSVHGNIGGLMRAFMSPVDPLFWLHHANLDRLWMIWTNREKNSNRPGLPVSADRWLSEPLRFFCAADGQPLPDARAADYVDMDHLGYSYGPGSADAIASKPRIVTATESALMAFASNEANVPLGTFVEASLSVAVPVGVMAPPVSPAESLTAAPFWFVAVTLKPPSNSTNYTILVFANCPYLTADTPITDPHYVGSIRFFGVEHLDEVTYSLPLSTTLLTLDAIGHPVIDEVRLQLLTLDETGQGGTLDGALKKVTIRQV